MKSARTARAHVRRVAGIALALTLFGSLAACGGDDPKAGAPEAAASSSTPPPEPDTEPLTGSFPLPKVGPMSLLKESRANHLGKLAFRHVYWNALLPGRPLGLPADMQTAGKVPV